MSERETGRKGEREREGERERKGEKEGDRSSSPSINCRHKSVQLYVTNMREMPSNSR